MSQRIWGPVVGRRWLFLVAGITWMGVSLMLGTFAIIWLSSASWTTALPMALAGTLLAVIAYRAGFVSLALKNIERIQQLPERTSLFNFLAWKSYLMIAVMATGGSLLRHSALPRPYLAVVYLGMGGCLFLSSLHYYPPAWPPF